MKRKQNKKSGKKLKVRVTRKENWKKSRKKKAETKRGDESEKNYIAMEVSGDETRENTGGNMKRRGGER